MPGIPANRLRDVLCAACGANRSRTGGLVAQPLKKYSTGRAARADGLAPGMKQGLAAGVAAPDLGDPEQRDLGQPEGLKDLPGGVQLSAAAVDDDESAIAERIIVGLAVSLALAASPSGGFNSR